MALKYLLCPQCGGHRFFVKDAAGTPIYFHVDGEGQPFATAESRASLENLDFSTIYCTACSWSGRIGKLVKVFTGT